MTEGDKAFYKRRIREELNKANLVGNRHLRQLHLRWALLYQERLDGVAKAVTRTLEARLRAQGIPTEQMGSHNAPETAISFAENGIPERGSSLASEASQGTSLDDPTTA